MDEIRIVVVDDHPVVADGIRAALGPSSQAVVVGRALDGRSSLAVVDEARPDLVILDVVLPDIPAQELIAALHAHPLQPKILIFTFLEDPAYAQQMFRLGADGYLVKRSPSDELERAITSIQRGGVYVDPIVAGKLFRAGDQPSPETEQAQETPLSDRETAVLKLLSRGLTNKEVGFALGITSKSVSTYRARALEKLGLHSRADIVRYGAGKGWLMPESGDS